MFPEICKIGPVTVYSYGLSVVAAFLVASGLAYSQAKRQNFHPDAVFNFMFTAFIAGIIGARLFYIIENAAYYRKNPLEIIMLQRGGLSWFGGFIAGVLCSAIYLKKKRIPVYKTLDLIAPFLALGQSIGRVGCLLNGCCFGRESGSGIYFPVHGSVLIPTQAYSALLLLVTFIFLRFRQERPHREGEIFLAYLLFYALKRFFIEFWRADNPVIAFGLTLFQFISIALFFFALSKLISIKRKQLTENR